jgi:hypothetical protein
MITTQETDKDFKFLNVVADGKDGIHVRHNYSSITGCRVINNVPHKGHIDGIQLIPMNDWFALGKLEHIRLRNNHILSKANLQGICGFDGIFSRIIITENEIKTTSIHKITINGMLDGMIRGNVDNEGKPIVTTLNPARIGGGNNLWVMSFRDTYKYEEIKGDPRYINDKRQDTKRKGWLLYDFPLMEFRRQFRLKMSTDGLVSGNEQARFAAELALKLCEKKKEVK